MDKISISFSNILLLLDVMHWETIYILNVYLDDIWLRQVKRMGQVILLIRVPLVHMRDRWEQVFASMFFFHSDLRNTFQCASTLTDCNRFFFSIEYMFSLIVNETQDLFFPLNRGQVLNPILAVLHARVHTSVLALLHLCEYPHMLILVHGYSTNQIHL